MDTIALVTQVRAALQIHTTPIETVETPEISVDILFDWFDQQQGADDPSSITVIGFTYLEPRPGEVTSLLQGLFCAQTARIVRMRRLTGPCRDRSVADLHHSQDLLVYM